MKISYIAQYDGNPKSGVTKKLLAQLDAMNQKNGVEACLRFLTKKDCKTKFRHDYVEFIDFPAPPFKGRLDKVWSFLTLFFYLNKLLQRLKSDDVIYFRNFYPFYFFEFLIKRRNGVFIDVPSNNIKEAEIRGSILYRNLYLKNASLIGNVATGITSVTHELITINFPNLNSNIPKLAIGNGFDVSSVPVAKLESGTDYFNIICVANFSFWHGIDRFIIAMSTYSLKNKFKLHLVGEGPEISNIRALVKSKNLEDNVCFYGFLSGTQLDILFNRVHLAIGNLGTHRKSISYTSPLKNREYCSRGIPFIYTCIDDDFKKDFPFALRVESTDSPINLDEVTDFYSGLLNEKPEYQVEMHKYAELYLSWKKKTDDLVNFFERNLKGYD